MIITDSAKIMLNEALDKSKNACLHIILHQSCCGEGIFMQMEKLPEKAEVVLVNGISVRIDDNAVARSGKVTIDTKDGRFIMIDPEAASGCC